VSGSDPGNTGRSIEAWPFAVMRNPVLDWRPVLAPPFLIDSGGDYGLVLATWEASAQMQVRVIENSRDGALTLVFRRVPATGNHIGDGAPDASLHDRHGRPISIVEGLVIPGRRDAPARELTHAMEQVDTLLREHLPQFWNETDEAASAARSSPLTLTAARARRARRVAFRLSAGLRRLATTARRLPRRARP
jgi:hypothetical protein